MCKQLNLPQIHKICQNYLLRISRIAKISELARFTSTAAAHNVLLLSVQKQKKSRRAQERKLAEIFSLSINVVSGRVCQVFGQLFEGVSTREGFICLLYQI